MYKNFNPNLSMFGVVCNQKMLNMKMGPIQPLFNGYPKSSLSVAGVFAYFGHHITDQDVLQTFAINRSKEKSFAHTYTKINAIIRMLFFSIRKIPNMKRKFLQENYGEFALSMKSISLEDKIDYIYHNVVTRESPFRVHGPASFCSIVYSMLLLKVLKSSTNTRYVESDFNLLMSHCNDVVSCEVPNTLKKIAKFIKNKDSFVQLTDEDALKTLQSKLGNENDAAKLFIEFLNKHGHRGFGELDVLNLPFQTNPIPCVQVIKVIF